ncbi:MAG: hypothetical protein DBX59_08060 [Bacillota bacterium]|nr:MAG: hypothetical protein DBX59_08060 [Bacillota bacterium]
MFKRKALKTAGIAAGIVLLAFLLAVVVVLSLGYRFTSASAAGKGLQNCAVVQTPEYDFYCINVDLMNGEEKIGEATVNVCPVRKFGFLYKSVEYDACKVAVKNADRRYVGVLASFEGENGYYNFFLRYILQEELSYQDTVKINGEEISLHNGSYFKSKEKVLEFELGDKVLCVVDNE